MRIVKGTGLEETAQSLSTMRNGRTMAPRDLLPMVADYLACPPAGRACVLHGLRRTGKTVLMMQAYNRLPEEEKTKSAYVVMDASDTLDALDSRLEVLHNAGIRHLFIDEVTEMPEFIEHANYFSDIVAAGGSHVVLAGTQSLGFALAAHDRLYDRARMIDTTWVPYHEHVRLLNDASIDAYLETGGILSENRNELFPGYALDAIAKNIEYSLRHYKNGTRFGILEELRRDGLFTTAVNNIVNDDQHRFVMEVVRDHAYKNLEYAKRTLTGTQEGKVLRQINNEAVMQRFFDSLSIRRKTFMMGRITKRHIQEINLYLRMMKVVEPRPILALQDVLDPDSPLLDKLQPENSFDCRGEWLLAQPGLRWAQVKALVRSLKDEFALEDGRRFLENLDRDERQAIFDGIFRRLEDLARGRLLEDIIAVHARRTWGRENHVFVFRGPGVEIDMVVADRNGNGFKAYEIKNSLDPKREHARHVRNELLMQSLESRFGTLRERQILYRGKDMETPACRFRNIGNFLLEECRAPGSFHVPGSGLPPGKIWEETEEKPSAGPIMPSPGCH